MPDTSGHHPEQGTRRERRDRAGRGAHRAAVPPRPRHTADQQPARLVRAVVVAVVVLALGSALLGYLLHGRGSTSAGAQSTRSSSSSSTAPASAPRLTSTTSPVTRSSSTTARPTTAAVPAHGNGRFNPVTVPQTTTARTGRVVTYALSVEGGMGADPAAVAKAFGSALLDRRGWQGVDHVRFVQMTHAALAKGTKPEMVVLVASPDQVKKLCAPLPTHGDTSCDTSEHVVLNYKLWTTGVPYFAGHVDEYREYMVNHEVGHALGHGHQQCSAKGAYAPVMQQQTLDLQGCKPWPWPKRPNAQGQA
ncbi:DUF3152 domain-containing protein [Flexivirga caeni]|uniref:DUF3152 domain-containing protein n=1 Tax=Flexivirga caeni TaxID=2294115 RepID=UPI0013150E78|nr:DUF3152 domain-containing protein [Flexivirga caeni]